MNLNGMIPNRKVIFRETIPGIEVFRYLKFQALAENCTFLNRKLTNVLNETVDGHYMDFSTTGIRRFREGINVARSVSGLYLLINHKGSSNFSLASVQRVSPFLMQ